jgi:hypothetical protein
VESFWLDGKKKISKKHKNNKIIEKLRKLNEEGIKPYIVVEMKEESIWMLYEQKSRKEKILWRAEVKMKNGITLIPENKIKWKPKKNNTYELFKWYDISKEIPEMVLSNQIKIYASVINYRNTSDKWLFNSLIARMFAGSWELNVTQDFQKKNWKRIFIRRIY